MIAVDHLPVLQVVGPLIAAPICSLLRARNLAWFFTLLVSIGAFLCSIYLLNTVLETGPISYAIGGWAAPLGIEYRVDASNGFVLLIISGISSVVLPFAKRSFELEVPENQHSLLYTAYILCLTGLLGITATADAFNVFVFLEVSSLSTYVLVAAGAKQDRRALTAAYNYLILGTIGATFFVIGVGLLYMATGTLNMADLAARVGPIGGSRTLDVGFAFIVIGLALKLALFPLHNWLPNAYTYAPSAVTAFLAATATKAAVYLLLRFCFTIFGSGSGFLAPMVGLVCMPLALAGMFAGSLAAIYQYNLKRMLAYSSVAQIGYMVLGISFLSITGLMATTLHLFNHALMKGALFMALGCVFFRVRSVNINDLSGIARQMPWTMAAFVISGLSLIGVPLTVGFISKWYLISAALEQEAWVLIALILASSLLAVIYIWRVIEVAYLKDPIPGRTVTEAPLSMLLPTWALVIANIYFGVDASLTTRVARMAAEGLVGVAQ
ncbi:monovalent cation/H+ antiporter subunit D family protein [Nisaea nitritireducens]|uniref:monovalent cation/H+ antiporter subunit D family protein n=1 Tax=Nisaea nitritireducens TaxID=568392 RepID=UPI0018689DED|nr:monovalent cation/H+ antiporter subunit D family protein [Nisaea nitritireducens]